MSKRFKIALIGSLALATLSTSPVLAELEESQVRNLVIERALAHGVSPRMLLCVVQKESRFRPSARGKRGEYGLAQWMPGPGNAWDYTTAAQMGISITAEYERGNPDAPYFDVDAMAELFARGASWRRQHWYNTIRGCE